MFWNTPNNVIAIGSTVYSAMNNGAIEYKRCVSVYICFQTILKRANVTCINMQSNIMKYLSKNSKNIWLKPQDLNALN